MQARSALILAAATLAAAASSALAATQEVAPDVLKLAVAPRAFKAMPSGGSIVVKGGAIVSFKIATSSQVDFRVSALKPGHKTATGCVPGAVKSAKKRCSRVVAVPGSFTLVGIPGTNTINFSGRVADTKLKPGDYRLTAKAHGLAARSSYTTFAISK